MKPYVAQDLKVDYRFQEAWAKPLMWLEMFLGALGGGLFIISVLLDHQVGAVTGYVILVAGKGLFLLLDLGRPERFLKVFSRPLRSWISAGAWGFALFAVAGLAYLLVSALAGGGGAGENTIGGIAVALGVLLIVYDGFSLADSKGVPLWKGGGLPLMYGISGLLAGSGAILITRLFREPGASLDSMAKLNLILVIGYAVMLLAYLVTASAASAAARQSVFTLTRGSLRAPFWGGVVAAGTAVPLVMVSLAVLGVGGPGAMAAVAGGLEIGGALFLRYCVLLAGVYAPVY